MYCKFLKLSNGDDIIVQTNDLCESFKDKEFLEVTEPVLISSMRIPRGPVIIETYVMQPWIKMARANVVSIPTTSIIVAVDVHEIAEEQYFEFVEESNKKRNNSEESILLDDQDESAQDMLEAFLQSMNETSDEEEDDDGNTRVGVGRTIH